MEKDLNKLGLMQLRVYAKSIGVKAPTSYTKNELIKKIKEIKDGIVSPYFTDRGRPQLNTFIDIEENLNDNNISLNSVEIENLELRKKIMELNN
ncbi:MAG: hypothetical protein KBS91_04665, partial [Firmicutes bacterium]|nr:hypothetical protein [Candidatus Caballimonas caccae]